jgi:hypothetical protein
LKALRVLDISAPIYVKRGNLHALGPDDVRRVEGLEELKKTTKDFALRDIDLVYLQQEAAGAVVKFYGVGEDYFSVVLGEGRPLTE